MVGGWRYRFNSCTSQCLLSSTKARQKQEEKFEAFGGVALLVQVLHVPVAAWFDWPLIHFCAVIKCVDLRAFYTSVQFPIVLSGQVAQGDASLTVASKVGGSCVFLTLSGFKVMKREKVQK